MGRWSYNKLTQNCWLRFSLFAQSTSPWTITILLNAHYIDQARWFLSCSSPHKTFSRENSYVKSNLCTIGTYYLVFFSKAEKKLCVFSFYNTNIRELQNWTDKSLEKRCTYNSYTVLCSLSLLCFLLLSSHFHITNFIHVSWSSSFKPS